MNDHRIPRLLLAGTALLAAALPAQESASSFGHARTREAAALGRLPTPLEVAVADIVNYHRHRLPLPRAGQQVALDLRFGGAAVRPGGPAYLQVGMTTAPAGDRADLPPLNLALVIDCSGSMAAAGKLTRVQQGLREFAGRLRADDRVALVTYADEAEVRARSRPVGDGRWLLRAIDGLRPGGSTNLHAGLMLGLQEVAAELLAAGSNRVVLLTDGIANRGVTGPEQILRDAEQVTRQGVDLTTIGVGHDLNTALLDRLARGGRGLFHFVADGDDIAKVFRDEADSLLAVVARRAELRVALDPDLVLEHVYGHEFHRDRGGHVTVALPDMNRGMTAVVLLRCRARRDLAAGTRLLARAELVAQGAAVGAAVREQATAALRVDRARTEPPGDALSDVEVRKNQTIAELAQGLHDMAVAAEQHRWAQAERALRRALRTARSRYGHGDDADVAAVLQIAADHERTLRRYVDRFRDSE